MSPRISRICTYLFLAKIHGFLAKTQSSRKKLHESHVSTRIFEIWLQTTDNRQRIARARKEKIRVNPCDTWKMKEIILSVYEVFISLSLEFETKLKKEETANKKIIIQTKLNFNDIK